METSKFIEDLVRDECIGGKPALRPYRDSVRSAKYPQGILTIGIGRNLEDCGITAEEAYHLCRNDIEGVEADLDHAAPWWRHLDEVRQRVIANMCFNMGIERLLKFRKMLDAAARRDDAAVVREMKDSAWYEQVGVRGGRLVVAWATGVMPLLLVLAACTQQVKKTADVEVKTESKLVLDIDKDVAKTKQQGPSEVDIKTIRDDNAVVVEQPDGSIEVAKVDTSHPLRLNRGAKVVGTVPLVKTTTELDRHDGAKTETENVNTKAKEVDTASGDATVAAAEETDTDVGPGWKFYAACIVGGCALLALIAWLAERLVKRYFT